MINVNNLIGKTYGYYTVKNKSEEKTKEKRQLYLNCICKCGNIGTVSYQNLKMGNCKSCGCSMREKLDKEMIGTKIGHLLILSRAHEVADKRRHEYYFKCKCDCGKEHFITRNNLINKGSENRTCGCGGYKIGDLNRQKNRKEILFKRLFELMIKVRSKSKRFFDREITCNIDLETFKKIIVCPCFYCGKEYDKTILDEGYKGERKWKISDQFINYNGLDRIDSSKGYDKDNVRACCRMCNFAKYTMTTEQFKEHITKIYNHFILNNSV